MKSVNTSDNPIFRTNTLYLQDISDDNPRGLYSPLVDAILLFDSADDVSVLSHEIEHRAFLYALNLDYNAFEIIRRLAIISYTLSRLLFEIALKGQVYIRGTNINELECEGGHLEARLAIEELVKRIQFTENIIDMGWRGLEIIAEMAAIDTVVGREGIKVDDIWLHKTYEIEKLIARYPSDYGGYNVSFGSFQDAVRHAWVAYSMVNHHEARRELLGLCTYTLYLDENDQIQVLDPIKVITESAPFACKHSDQAISAFIAHREKLSSQGKRLVETLENVILQGISSGPVKFSEVLKQLVLKQLQGNLYFGADAAIRGMTHSFSGWSFLIFIGQKGYNRVIFQLPYLTEINHGPSSIPKDWWQDLLFFETLRQVLKTGGPLVCPLRGWARMSYFGIRGAVTPDEIKCSKNCKIRRYLDILDTYCELIDKEASCDIHEAT